VKVNYMQKLMPTVEIENVVASVSYDHMLDLEVIAKMLPSSRYNPQHFPGLVYHSKKPKASMLIFSSGKVVCSGMTSERQVRRAAGKITYELKSSGIVIVNEPDVRIQNMVASLDLGGKVDLETTAYRLEKTFYDPDQFPGLVYRMENPKITFVIFSSGKAICTGARRKADILDGVDRLQAALEINKLIDHPQESA